MKRACSVTRILLLSSGCCLAYQNRNSQVHVESEFLEKKRVKGEWGRLKDSSLIGVYVWPAQPQSRRPEVLEMSDQVTWSQEKEAQGTEGASSYFCSFSVWTSISEHPQDFKRFPTHALPGIFNRK